MYEKLSNESYCSIVWVNHPSFLASFLSYQSYNVVISTGDYLGSEPRQCSDFKNTQENSGLVPYKIQTAFHSWNEVFET